MESSEKNLLVKQRAVIKGSLTRISKYADKFVAGSDINTLRSRLKQLPSLWEEYKHVQCKLEINDDENSETHEQDREQFEENYFDLEAKMTTLIDRSITSEQNNDQLSQHSCGNSQQASLEVRLPVINLPTFHGQYETWTHFQDTFQALIVDNLKLSNIQRFHYLLSALKGEPHQLIQNIPISNPNFPVAWEIVCKRYNNRKLIATQHIKALLSLPNCHKDTASDLRKLNNHLVSNLNAIQNLNLSVPLHEVLLQQLMLDKLDPATRKEYEMKAPSDNFPRLTEVSTFLEERAQVLELMMAAREQRGNTANPPKNQHVRNNDNPGRISSYVSTRGKCDFCDADHPVHRCEGFLKASVRQRYDFVKRKGLCFNCFRHHNVSICKSDRCKRCQGRHHTLIHFDSPTNSQTTTDRDALAGRGIREDEGGHSKASYCTLKFKPQSQIMLSTAVIGVADNNGRVHQCRALLDNGSQSHFITESLASKLKLQRHRSCIPISGINNTAVTASQSVDVRISSNVSNFETVITCSILPHITGNIPANYVDCKSWNLPKDITLADPHFNEPGSVDMLIGAEIFMQLLREGWRKNCDELPILKNTALGWILSGPIKSQDRTSKKAEAPPTSSFFLRQDDDLDRKMEKFWSIEEVTTRRTNLTKEEQYCEEHFTTHTRRDDSGRFSVRLPTREESPQLGKSYKIAEKRFRLLEQRFEKRPDLRADYVRFMEEYENLGHMKLAPDISKDEEACCYLPHHAVLKAESTTTKTRVVFDASCKTDNGVSLNDTLAVGPTVQQDLLSIVTRFRTHQIAMTADVTKMYRQIRVDDEDVNLQRILWRKHPSELLRTYQLKTVTYGTSSASFLATRCLTQLAEEEAHAFPTASRVLKRDFYMDDVLCGSDTVENAIQLRGELQELLQRGGFPLRKWTSNHAAVLETIPKELRESQLPLRFDKEDNIRTLGLLWHPFLDKFQFEVHIKENSGSPTKRKVLSIIASIFDPLGLIGPVIVRCKIFMQQLWQEKLGWDEPLPSPLLEGWIKIFTDLPALNNIHVDRLILSTGRVILIQVHGFSDASERAYGACVYIRSTNQLGEVSVKLVCSKSRVAPLKQQSLPRLELCGALLLARLVDKTTNTLNLKIDHMFLWTDSTIVLSWLAAEPTKWKTFVANRVSEIQQLTGRAKWGHVMSEDNPSDILSRGEGPLSLQCNQQWWHGPAWLLQDLSSWPTRDSNDSAGELPERRDTVQCLVSATPSDEITTRFSSLRRLQRVMAYCNRFMFNSRRHNVRKTGPLSAEELETGLQTCIKLAQRVTFAREIGELKSNSSVSQQSAIRNLNPFLDGNDLLRVGGRLQNSLKPFAERHQIILPQRHNVTQLIMADEHVRLLHAGANHVTASLRSRYWIVSIKKVIRTVIHKCLKCFRLRATTATQLMGQLPSPRVTPSRPFLNTGVDYAGPLYIKQGATRSKVKVKCYVALFVCLCTKAIHLELVRDLTTQAFIAALRRFAARRGRCTNLYSDNATNFVGARNELLRVHQSEQWKIEMLNNAAQEGFTWHFIPPDSPHFGGLWEAGVKSMKHHLRRTAGNACLTYDEMYTLLCQIEACLNSRPLVSLSDDPDEPSYLTPGHFLIGAPLLSFPEPDLRDGVHCYTSRWRYIQALQQKFWRQWSNDYLNSLQQRQKWLTSQPNLQPGTVVLVKDDNTPPLSWRLATVEETYPGKDGRVRAVTIRTSSGILKRSVHKLCPLPIQD